MKYSATQASHIVQLISAAMVILGAKAFSPEEANALVVVIGIIAGAVSWITAWWARYRAGDLTIAGVKKEKVIN